MQHQQYEAGQHIMTQQNTQNMLDLMRTKGLTRVCIEVLANSCCVLALLLCLSAAGLKLSAHLKEKQVLSNPACLHLPVIASVFTVLPRPRCCIHYSAPQGEGAPSSSRATLCFFYFGVYFFRLRQVRWLSLSVQKEICHHVISSSKRVIYTQFFPPETRFKSRFVLLQPFSASFYLHL